jgi:hypothetical protein
MNRCRMMCLLAVLAGAPRAAWSAPGEFDCSTQATSSAGEVSPTAPADAPAAQPSDEVFTVRSDRHVRMLQAVLTKKPYSASEVACDYMIERNLELAEPLMRPADYGCSDVDEFVRRDRIAAVVPQIEAELATLSKRKEFRVLLSVPVQEYDFKRGGFPIDVQDMSEVSIKFLYQTGESISFAFENGARLALAKMDEARARTLKRNSWLLELTIRPTEYREWKDRISWKHRTIRARILSARLFTSERGAWNYRELIADARYAGDRPLCEVVLERAPAQERAARKR